MSLARHYSAEWKQPHLLKKVRHKGNKNVNLLKNLTEPSDGLNEESKPLESHFNVIKFFIL